MAFSSPVPHFLFLALVGSTWSGMVAAQAKPPINSISVEVHGSPTDRAAEASFNKMIPRAKPLSEANTLFPLAPQGLGPTGQPLPKEEEAPEFVAPPMKLVATNVQVSATPKIRWLLYQSSERSANTGQLTCMGWARSINLAKALEGEGPFNAVVASASEKEDLGVALFWNNSAEATVTPLSAKWDAPIWAHAPADAPVAALSALYQFSKTTKGSANIAVVWDGQFLEKFESAWLDGLVKAGDMDGLQAFSWKQKIRKWTSADKTRVDVIEYAMEAGKVKNFQWRTMNLRTSGPNYGCPTS